MGGLERRIKDLESTIPGDGCPVCGYDPQSHMPYEIVLDDAEDEERAEGEPGEPEFCDGCGQRLTIVFGDDPWLRQGTRKE